MSHGPCGLAGGMPGLVSACCAIVKVALTMVSASESIFPRWILVFMLYPVCPLNWLQNPKETDLAAVLAANSFELSVRNTYTT
jgi:hypothetical protein